MECYGNAFYGCHGEDAVYYIGWVGDANCNDITFGLDRSGG